MPPNQEHINGNTLQYAERNDHVKAPLSAIPSVEHSFLPPGYFEKQGPLIQTDRGTGGDLQIRVKPNLSIY